jgi:hypothetical protein
VFSCATVEPDDTDRWGLVHISHLVAQDPTLAVLADMPVGWAAFRSGTEQAWLRERSPR